MQTGGATKIISATNQTKQTFSSFDLPAEHSGSENLSAGSFHFTETPLEQFLKIYAAVSGRTIIRGPLPGAKITLDSGTPMPRMQALQMFDSALVESGIAMVLVGDNAVKAVPVGGVMKENFPEITLPWELLPDSSSPMTRTVQLKNVKATDVMPILAPLSKLRGSIIAIQDRNLLILRDYASSIKQQLKLLETLEQKYAPQLGQTGGGTNSSPR